MKIPSNLFWKSTDGNQYLYYDSCHAERIKRSIVFGQTLLLRRIYSEKNDLDGNVENVKDGLGKGITKNGWLRSKSLVHFSPQEKLWDRTIKVVCVIQMAALERVCWRFKLLMKAKKKLTFHLIWLFFL